MQSDTEANVRVAQRLWEAIAESDVEKLEQVLGEKPVWRMYGRTPFAGVHVGVDSVIGFLSQVGELADELESGLLDILASDRGAVLHYSVRARRGDRTLDAEQLVQITIEDGRIVEAVFAPIDQERYDRFWLDT